MVLANPTLLLLHAQEMFTFPVLQDVFTAMADQGCVHVDV
jgi:hypothetical protein